MLNLYLIDHPVLFNHTQAFELWGLDDNLKHCTTATCKLNIQIMNKNIMGGAEVQEEWKVLILKDMSTSPENVLQMKLTKRQMLKLTYF
jgi:hypothetical protein